MPEAVVDSLPEPLTTGIYYGFSNVDGGTVFKTVLSIGWNPFYHNTKKSLVSSAQVHSICDLRMIIFSAQGHYWCL